MALIEIEENDSWIDDFQPPPIVQDTVKRVRELELLVKELQLKIEFSEKLNNEKYN
jgi:hypothetical protein